MTRYLLQLMLAHGIGDKAIKKILRYIRNTNYTLQTLCDSPEIVTSIVGRNKLGQELAESIRSNAIVADKLMVCLEKEGINVITENDSTYPMVLKNSLQEDCPPVLFVKGNIHLLSNVSVGFCGSRKVSKKGEYITEQCAAQCAEQNITVVSGYASGTDLAAHTSALKQNGTTIFVLAEGILNYRIKKQIRPLLNEENHLFISQFLPEAQWNVGNAMRRNGLIIGLSRAMILVESGKTGGTFAAGEETLRRKKPLFVIDFEKPEVSAEANPFFIQRGGNPIRGINGIPCLKNVFSALEQKSMCNVPEQLRIDTLVYTG